MRVYLAIFRGAWLRLLLYLFRLEILNYPWSYHAFMRMRIYVALYFIFYIGSDVGFILQVSIAGMEEFYVSSDILILQVPGVLGSPVILRIILSLFYCIRSKFLVFFLFDLVIMGYYVVPRRPYLTILSKYTVS